MKTATILSVAALATSAFAAPEPTWGKDYKGLRYYGKHDDHKGGWGKYYKGKHHKGKYNKYNKPKYEAPKYEELKDDYEDEDMKEMEDFSPIPFTSTYKIKATPDQVVNGTDDGPVFTGGLPGCTGYYNFGINSDYNTICYFITLKDFRGMYQSAANTATHVHEAPKGQTGPPRLAFPNPARTGEKDTRVSIGCLQGPFTTGILDDNGVDTGAGFHVSQIEEDPDAFFCDAHSSLAVPGAVRGQLY